MDRRSFLRLSAAMPAVSLIGVQLASVPAKRDFVAELRCYAESGAIPAVRSLGFTHDVWYRKFNRDSTGLDSPFIQLRVMELDNLWYSFFTSTVDAHSYSSLGFIEWHPTYAVKASCVAKIDGRFFTVDISGYGESGFNVAIAKGNGFREVRNPFPLCCR